ncbi:hypothetical protein AFM11_29550 [Mycolicibacterium wolinskyi]|uniref:Uncharacterized protein n=1 Tax=Mycolicibacterium wolinskyi TaxID=59750 RepID=A0A132PDZ8_9MYCO|nr:hypothetical protein AFM11_29550 [Mycolicibacterium wolinskyi]
MVANQGRDVRYLVGGPPKVRDAGVKILVDADADEQAFWRAGDGLHGGYTTLARRVRFIKR